jgi:hypothetical protein
MCSSVLLSVLRSVQLFTKRWRRNALTVPVADVSEQEVPSDDKLMNRKLSSASITGRQHVLYQGGGSVAPPSNTQPFSHLIKVNLVAERGSDVHIC